ncbi:MAG: hypothetical protein ACKOTB_13480 [Planctomycetia bacterium]
MGILRVTNWRLGGMGARLALAMTLLAFSATQPATAADYAETILPGTIASDSGYEDEGSQAALEPWTGGSPEGEAFAATPAGDILPTAHHDCPHGVAHGGHCDACDPPYGLVNRLLDNKQACWTVRTDALLLWRDAPRSRAIYNSFPSGVPALNANQLESTLAAGPRFSLFRTNGCGDAIEATYFRAANFRSQQALPFAANGYTPALVPIPTTYDSATANLGSALQSFEFNGRLAVCPTIQLLGGFRWFEWQENLLMTQTAGTSTETILTNCMNDLYGYQIGFDSLLLKTNWLRLEGLMKGGAYYNNSSQVTMIASPLGGIGLRADSPKGAAFVGEVGLTGVIPITSCLDLRVGYLGLWLQGLAQPTNQVTTIDASAGSVVGTLNTTGTAVVQGMSLGLEGRW